MPSGSDSCSNKARRTSWPLVVAAAKRRTNSSSMEVLLQKLQHVALFPIYGALAGGDPVVQEPLLCVHFIGQSSSRTVKAFPGYTRMLPQRQMRHAVLVL